MRHPIIALKRVSLFFIGRNAKAGNQAARFVTALRNHVFEAKLPLEDPSLTLGLVAVFW